MGLLKAIGNGARRAQLNGEIVVVDREMTARKRALGIELYDIIVIQNKRDKNNLLKTPASLKNTENSIRGPLDSCSRDIELMEKEKKALEIEAEVIEAKQDVDVSGGVGKKLKAGAREGQIYVKIAMINRNIRIRKEKFGTEIWDQVSTVLSESKKGKGIGGVIKGTVGKTLGKYDDEKEIEVCLNKAQEQISFMEERKKRKQREIERLSGSN